MQLRRGVAELSRDVVYLLLRYGGMWAYRVNPLQNLGCGFAKLVELQSSKGCHVAIRRMWRSLTGGIALLSRSVAYLASKLSRGVA